MSLLSSTPLVGRLAIAIALLGPLAGGAGFFLAHRIERRNATEVFARRLESRAAAIEHEIDRASVAVGSLASLMEAAPAIHGQEFRRFAAAQIARARLLEIQALEWAPRVEPAGRRAHELAMRAEGAAGYRIRGLDGGRAGGDGIAYPVAYVEPLDGNQPAVGADMASEERRRAALELAAATGGPVLSAPVRLLQPPGTSLGLILAVPVQDAAGAVPRGFALGVFRVEDLFGPLREGGASGAPREMAVEVLYREPGGGEERILAAHVDEPAAAGALEHPVDLAGTRVVLRARPTQAFLAGRRTAQPLLLGLALFAGVEFLAALAGAAAWRQRQRAQQAHDDLLRRILSTIPIGVMVADREGRIIVANDASIALLGTRRAPDMEDWARVFDLFVPGTDVPYPTEELPLVRAIRGEHVRSADVAVHGRARPDGAIVSVSGAPLLGPDDAIEGGVVVFEDVTESRRALAQIERLSSAVEQAADAVMITDANGAIEYVNAAFEKLTGYSRAEALARTPRLLKSGKASEEYYRTLWATITRGEPFTAIVQNRRKSGELFWAEQTITPMRGGQSHEIEHFVSVMRDIGSRLRLEEQEAEMRLAASVQERLFPHDPPRLAGYDVAGVVRPVLATCGDYFDFVALPDGRLAFVVADVCGHGLGASLIMVETRSLLRSLLGSGLSLEDTVERLDRELFADLSDKLFVTMLLAFLDPSSGELEWANLGHPPALLLDDSGELELLSSARPPLGLLPAGLRNPGGRARRTTRMRPGATLLAFTDGVIETTSPDDEELGIGRVLDLLRGTAGGCSARQIADGVLAAAAAFREGEAQHDDQTVVVCRREAARPRRRCQPRRHAERRLPAAPRNRSRGSAADAPGRPQLRGDPTNVRS